MEKERKLQIIRAAVKRFERHGLNKTTLEEIARDLRIGKATIYHYFNSKDDLFYETVYWESSLYLEDIQNLLGSPERTLQERLLEFFDYKRTVKHKYKLIYDVPLRIMTDAGNDKEREFLKELFLREEGIISAVLTPLTRGKSSAGTKNISAFLVKQSWGELFTGMLSEGAENEDAVKELYLKILSAILSD